MTAVWSNSEWHYELSLFNLREAEFEFLLLENPSLFSDDCFLIPFKKTVYAPDGNSARADLAIIREDFSEWFVVEVEMNRHSFDGHVLPQVRTLRDAYYGPELIAYIEEKVRELGRDCSQVENIIKGNSPTVIVIADRDCLDWRKRLETANVLFIAFELFKSEKNKYIFRVDGSLPSRPIEVLSYARFHGMLPRTLTIVSPAVLPADQDRPLRILFEGQTAEWRRCDIADQCMIRTRAPVSLDARTTYALKRIESGLYELSASEE